MHIFRLVNLPLCAIVTVQNDIVAPAIQCTQCTRPWNVLAKWMHTANRRGLINKQRDSRYSDSSAATGNRAGRVSFEMSENARRCARDCLKRIDCMKSTPVLLLRIIVPRSFERRRWNSRGDGNVWFATPRAPKSWTRNEKHCARIILWFLLQFRESNWD